jgi:FkbM family methyltransferase
LENLIFDIGLHMGEDTAYYLQQGFSVIAVDANPDSMAAAQKKFEPYVNSGQLTLVNCAITDFEGDINFNISNESVWSSLNFEVANRNKSVKEIISVKARPLCSLINEYGEPHYCKIDIEGSDKNALESLFKSQYRPRFISVETECTGIERQLGEEEALETLLLLKKLGYEKFKLVDQVTLCSLLPGRSFYDMRFLDRIRHRAQFLFWKSYRDRLSTKFNWRFIPGGSGPFGDDIAGRWLDFNSAKVALLFHRDAYYKQGHALNYGFWCDWHAKC